MILQRLTEELPNEVAIDIFLKLPVKSLIRFRCVSKSLSASVQSPNFIASHQKQIRDPQIILKRRRSNFRIDKTYFTIFSTEFQARANIQMPFLDDCLFDPVVDGPCNGLLCLSDHDRIALWNPSTREFKHVPPSTIRRPPETEMTDFGPVGFGFDSRSGEYKVIRFITNSFEDGMGWTSQVEIYCLNSNSWREIPAPNELVHGYSTFGDFENGLYHWSGTGSDGGLIISFNLTNESFTTTALPEFEEDYLWKIVKCSGGAVTLIAYPRDGEEKVFDLWVKRDGWIKELSIGPFPGIKRPLGCWTDERLFLESNVGELLLLDLQSGGIENFGVSAFPGKMQVTVYAESLVPINGRTEQQEGIVREMIHH